MKIRTTEIPSTGADTEFTLSPGALNERVRVGDDKSQKRAEHLPEIRFVENPQVRLHLTLEGTTVSLSGTARGKFLTECSRCGEETTTEEVVEINLVLKPAELEDRKEEEDLNFGYYDGKEIDCSSIAEEFLVLNIPFVSLCDADCKGLCAGCGANLNREKCRCSEIKPSGGPFSVLKDLKLN